MKFSERKGYKKFKKCMQIESVDIDLRNGLWNILDLSVFNSDALKQGYQNDDEEWIKYIFTLFWIRYYKQAYDSMPNYVLDMYQKLRDDFFSCPWYEVYDFIEELIKYLKESDSITRNSAVEQIEEGLNNCLQRENSAYRFINGMSCEITNKQEITEVEKALDDDDFPYVKEHLTKALELLSNKQNPDYRNSIKESISAVENIACLLAQKQKATLGDALKELEKNGKLHESLKQGFLKIYGYTSDDDGIRHALMDKSDLGKSDAYLFFLLCTSFTNYLKTKF